MLNFFCVLAPCRSWLAADVSEDHTTSIIISPDDFLYGGSCNTIMDLLHIFLMGSAR
jgi:hypothetical protein